jgi:hypothetical protein
VNRGFLSNRKEKAFPPIAVQDRTCLGTIKSCAYRPKKNQVSGIETEQNQGQVMFALGKMLETIKLKLVNNAMYSLSIIYRLVDRLKVPTSRSSTQTRLL